MTSLNFSATLTKAVKFVCLPHGWTLTPVSMKWGAVYERYVLPPSYIYNFTSPMVHTKGRDFKQTCKGFIKMWLVFPILLAGEGRRRKGYYPPTSMGLESGSECTSAAPAINPLLLWFRLQKTTSPEANFYQASSWGLNSSQRWLLSTQAKHWSI